MPVPKAHTTNTVPASSESRQRRRPVSLSQDGTSSDLPLHVVAPLRQQRQRRKRGRPRNQSRRNKHRLVMACGAGQIFLGILLIYWDWTEVLFQGVSWFLSSSSSTLDQVVVQPVANQFLDVEIEDPRLDNFLQDLNVTHQLWQTSRAIGYGNDAFGPLQSKLLPADPKPNSHGEKDAWDVNYTLRVLEGMGVDRSELAQRQVESYIPPWSQIVDNYGSQPVILGLERCPTYRQRVEFRGRHLGPAGIFSSGTNLLQEMLYQNCMSPAHKQPQRNFNLWQAPWGKHNPEGARLQHIAMDQEFRNQSAVLPIVTVRHPYTWLLSICRHPYALVWNHSQELCHETLALMEPVQALWGALHTSTQATQKENKPGRIPEFYESLIHVWKDWNLAYFQQRDYPLLMVRFEDLVYRPQSVVEQVCACAGGHMKEDPFTYVHESANLGRGHGDLRSDLTAALLKYSQPLQRYHKMYSRADWSVLDKVLDDDSSFFDALAYKR